MQVPDEISFVDGDAHIANTHDLMAMLLLSSMQRGVGKEQRAAAQRQAVEALFADMRAIAADEKAGAVGFDAMQQRVYEAFCAFTRRTIAGLSGKDNVCFKPLETIKRDDRIHVAATHHAVIQDLAFGYLATDPVSASCVSPLPLPCNPTVPLCRCPATPQCRRPTNITRKKGAKRLAWGKTRT